MSNIIRNTTLAPAVLIGERQRDAELEARAEQLLARLLPKVSFNTSPDGARSIPLQEVFRVEQEMARVRQESYHSGHQAGHAQGMEVGRREAREVLNRFDQAIKDAVEQRERLLEEARQKIVELVLRISRKVTFDAVEADREATVAMVAGVINQLVDRSRLRIKVHPDYLPIMEQNVNRFLEGSHTIKELTFEADPRVRSAGCLIETPTGDIDARLESALEIVREAVLSGEEAS